MCFRPQYKQWCSAMDQGKIPSEIKALLTGDDQKLPQGGSSTKTSKNSKNSISSNGQGWRDGLRALLYFYFTFHTHSGVLIFDSFTGSRVTTGGFWSVWASTWTLVNSRFFSNKQFQPSVLRQGVWRLLVSLYAVSQSRQTQHHLWVSTNPKLLLRNSESGFPIHHINKQLQLFLSMWTFELKEKIFHDKCKTEKMSDSSTELLVALIWRLHVMSRQLLLC